MFIVAEIGINHNGNLDIARRLVDAAKSAGADAVKFQKRTVERVYSCEVLDSPRASPFGTTTREQKLGLELGETEYRAIAVARMERKRNPGSHAEPESPDCAALHPSYTPGSSR